MKVKHSGKKINISLGIQEAEALTVILYHWPSSGTVVGKLSDNLHRELVDTLTDYKIGLAGKP